MKVGAVPDANLVEWGVPGNRIYQEAVAEIRAPKVIFKPGSCRPLGSARRRPSSTGPGAEHLEPLVSARKSSKQVTILANDGVTAVRPGVDTPIEDVLFIDGSGASAVGAPPDYADIDHAAKNAISSRCATPARPRSRRGDSLDEEDPTTPTSRPRTPVSQVPGTPRPGSSRGCPGTPCPRREKNGSKSAAELDALDDVVVASPSRVGRSTVSGSMAAADTSIDSGSSGSADLVDMDACDSPLGNTGAAKDLCDMAIAAACDLAFGGQTLNETGAADATFGGTGVVERFSTTAGAAGSLAGATSGANVDKPESKNSLSGTGVGAGVTASAGGASGSLGSAPSADVGTAEAAPLSNTAMFGNSARTLSNTFNNTGLGGTCGLGNTGAARQLCDDAIAAALGMADPLTNTGAFGNTAITLNNTLSNTGLGATCGLGNTGAARQLCDDAIAAALGSAEPMANTAGFGNTAQQLDSTGAGGNTAVFGNTAQPVDSTGLSGNTAVFGNSLHPLNSTGLGASCGLGNTGLARQLCSDAIAAVSGSAAPLTNTAVFGNTAQPLNNTGVGGNTAVFGNVVYSLNGTGLGGTCGLSNTGVARQLCDEAISDALGSAVEAAFRTSSGSNASVDDCGGSMIMTLGGTSGGAAKATMGASMVGASSGAKKAAMGSSMAGTAGGAKKATMAVSFGGNDAAMGASMVATFGGKQATMGASATFGGKNTFAATLGATGDVPPVAPGDGLPDDESLPMSPRPHGSTAMMLQQALTTEDSEEEDGEPVADLSATLMSICGPCSPVPKKDLNASLGDSPSIIMLDERDFHWTTYKSLPTPLSPTPSSAASSCDSPTHAYTEALAVPCSARTSCESLPKSARTSCESLPMSARTSCESLPKSSPRIKKKDRPIKCGSVEPLSARGHDRHRKEMEALGLPMEALSALGSARGRRPRGMAGGA